MFPYDRRPDRLCGSGRRRPGRRPWPEGAAALGGRHQRPAGPRMRATREVRVMDQRPPRSPETLAAQALGDVDLGSGGLAPVINLSTTYEQLPDGSYHQGRAYTRADNPTYEVAERLLAALEGAGCACVLFASGMAAVTAVFQSLLPGDHVLVGRVLYWGVRKWLAEFALTWGLDVEFVDRPDQAGVGGDAGQPDVGRHRSRRRLPGRPRRRGAGGGRQHRADAGADQADGVRGRSGCLFRHQVPQR